MQDNTMLSAPAPGQDDDEFLLSWIHLSDVHVGHGNASAQADQRIVWQEIVEDIERQVSSRYIPRKPDLLFLTGDIGATGASRNPSEYEQLSEWLDGLLARVGLTRKNVYLVPGNHDVARSADSNPNVRRMVAELRSNPNLLDTALVESGDASQIESRIRRYLDFSRSYGSLAKHFLDLGCALICLRFLQHGF